MHLYVAAAAMLVCQLTHVLAHPTRGPATNALLSSLGHDLDDINDEPSAFERESTKVIKGAERTDFGDQPCSKQTAKCSDLPKKTASCHDYYEGTTEKVICRKDGSKCANYVLKTGFFNKLFAQKKKTLCTSISGYEPHVVVVPQQVQKEPEPKPKAWWVENYKTSGVVPLPVQPSYDAMPTDEVEQTAFPLMIPTNTGDFLVKYHSPHDMLPPFATVGEYALGDCNFGGLDGPNFPCKANLAWARMLVDTTYKVTGRALAAGSFKKVYADCALVPESDPDHVWVVGMGQVGRSGATAPLPRATSMQEMYVMHKLSGADITPRVQYPTVLVDDDDEDPAEIMGFWFRQTNMRGGDMYKRLDDMREQQDASDEMNYGVAIGVLDLIRRLAAHELKIVNLDISPAQILFETKESSTPKMIDFDPKFSLTAPTLVAGCRELIMITLLSVPFHTCNPVPGSSMRRAFFARKAEVEKAQEACAKNIAQAIEHGDPDVDNKRPEPEYRPANPPTTNALGAKAGSIWRRFAERHLQRESNSHLLVPRAQPAEQEFMSSHLAAGTGTTTTRSSTQKSSSVARMKYVSRESRGTTSRTRQTRTTEPVTIAPTSDACKLNVGLTVPVDACASPREVRCVCDVPRSPPLPLSHPDGARSPTATQQWKDTSDFQAHACML
jgi:hypothetical protein